MDNKTQKFIKDIEKIYKKHKLYISSDMYGDRVIKDFKGEHICKLPYFSENEEKFKE